VKASAAKRGRNPKFPYVPIIDYGPQAQGVHRTRTEQIKNRAFETREEAVGYAERFLLHRAELLAAKLADPRHRALRKAHGLPEEIAQ
jgi:hypothetical protein